MSMFNVLPVLRRVVPRRISALAITVKVPQQALPHNLNKYNYEQREQSVHITIRRYNNNNRGHNNESNKYSSRFLLLTLGSGCGIFAYYYWQQQQKLSVQSKAASAQQNHKNGHDVNGGMLDTDIRRQHLNERKDLPTFQLQTVQHHNTLDKRVWITFGIGVYDITDFISRHPGSDKIMLGAGSAIDPFWEIYQQHNTIEILTLLESYRIGNIKPEDNAASDDVSSIWGDEPKRHPILHATSERPFNAEAPMHVLVDKFYTPQEFFYVRNHLPVPVIDEREYKLQVQVETKLAGAEVTRRTLSLNDIKAMPKYSVTAAVMCGGNRRSEMAEVKPIKGLSWSAGAVGNAVWTGTRLRDVLKEMGVQTHEELHVIFEGGDLDPTGNPYGASIPLTKALDERGDVLLAYEINGKPLSRDHGAPIRVIVPGTVGSRNVKWLTRIAISEKESSSHWQQNDYKGFSPSVDWDTVDFTKSPAIQAMPVTSAICTPMNGEHVTVDKDGYITVRGYAWSGGGRRIVRVDVTADRGENWHVASLEQENQTDGRHYGWTLWTVRIPVNKLNIKELELWSKAVDSAYNVQPESFKNIWNLRGVLSNAYHRIKIQIQK